MLRLLGIISHVLLEGLCPFHGSPFARIYPLYLTLLGIRVVVEAWKTFSSSEAAFLGPEPFTDGNSPFALLANALMIQAWGFSNEPTWIPTFWSVSAEWFAYLMFPLILFAQTRVRPAPILVATACFVAVSLWSLVLNQGTLEFPLRFSIFRCLPEFVIGMMLAMLFNDRLTTSEIHSGRVSSAANRLVPPLCFAGILFVHYALPDVLFLATVCVLLLLIPLTSDRLKALFEAKPLQSTRRRRLRRWSRQRAISASS